MERALSDGWLSIVLVPQVAKAVKTQAFSCARLNTNGRKLTSGNETDDKESSLLPLLIG